MSDQATKDMVRQKYTEIAAQVPTTELLYLDDGCLLNIRSEGGGSPQAKKCCAQCSIFVKGAHFCSLIGQSHRSGCHQ